jgi:hypothetical protein
MECARSMRAVEHPPAHPVDVRRQKDNLWKLWVRGGEETDRMDGHSCSLSAHNHRMCSANARSGAPIHPVYSEGGKRSEAVKPQKSVVLARRAATGKAEAWHLRGGRAR